jgi:hypothetical protein
MNACFVMRGEPPLRKVVPPIQLIFLRFSAFSTETPGRASERRRP